MSLRLKGITYDVCTFWTGGQSSRPDFDPVIVKQDIAVIANELHCNAIRISGEDIERLAVTAKYAIEQGLAVWLSPALINADVVTLMPYLTKCAERAATLLKRGDVTFVVGCEWTIFTNGLLPGSDVNERVKRMSSPFVVPKMMLRAIARGMTGKDPRPEVTQLNHMLSQAVEAVRLVFSGKLTYAAGEWEEVDWQPFDIVSVDYYRHKQSGQAYGQKLADYQKFDKPVAITEFGCCTYKGADKQGGTGWQVVQWHNDQPQLKKGLVRDEQVQADYLKEQLDIFTKQDVLGAFVYTFSNPTYIYSDNPAKDLDMASYGIVKPLKAREQQLLAWQPKAAFRALADYYK
jgi:hypothetical protein